MKNDTISRQAAIKAADSIIERDTSGNNDVVKAMTAWKEYIKGMPPTQLAQDLTNGCTDTISRRAMIDAVDGVDWYHQNKNGEMVHGANDDEHQAWYKADDIYKAIESVPSAHPDFGAYCDKVYQIALERGRREVIDFVSSMNMCDEVNDEAYKKLVIHFENIPLEGEQS